MQSEPERTCPLFTITLQGKSKIQSKNGLVHCILLSYKRIVNSEPERSCPMFTITLQEKSKLRARTALFIVYYYPTREEYNQSQNGLVECLLLPYKRRVNSEPERPCSLFTIILQEKSKIRARTVLSIVYYYPTREEYNQSQNGLVRCLLLLYKRRVKSEPERSCPSYTIMILQEKSTIRARTVLSIVYYYDPTREEYNQSQNGLVHRLLLS